MPDISQIIEAAQRHEWIALAGGIIMVLVWAFRVFVKNRLPAAVLPLVAAIVGVVAYIGTAFLAPDVKWYEALWSGLLASGEAALLWSIVGKRVLKRHRD